MLKLRFAFAVSLLGSLTYAQSPIKTASTAVDVAPTPVEQIKRSVLLLETDCYVLDPQGRPEVGIDRTPKLVGHAGTAFLLSVPEPRLGKDASFTYLVTNHHVAEPGIEARKPCNVARYVLRLDAKEPSPDGTYTNVLVLPAVALQWKYPTDDSVDLAVTPIALNWSKVDLISLPLSLFLSADEVKSNRIEEGDSTLFAGVFAQMIGQTHSEPIVREGKIAMVPREPVPTTLRPLGDIFLVDCHVFGGNSGSPMFVNLAGQRYNGLTAGINYRLLGVVSGYVTEGANFELQTVASYAGTVAANSGVAIVVPAQKVIDLVESSSLKAQRETAVTEFLKQQQPK